MSEVDPMRVTGLSQESAQHSADLAQSEERRRLLILAWQNIERLSAENSSLRVLLERCQSWICSGNSPGDDEHARRMALLNDAIDASN